MKDHLDLLEKVERVEVPPFMLTRIQAKIEARSGSAISYRASWLLLTSLILLLGINLTFLFFNQNGNDKNELSSSFSLHQSNMIYHE